MRRTQLKPNNYGLFRAMTFVALSVLLTLFTNIARAADDCGDAGNGSNDIKEMAASFDEMSGDITVKMMLCGGDASAHDNGKTDYRVYFDYRDAEGILGPDSVPNAECGSTSDYRIALRKGRTVGLGRRQSGQQASPSL